MRLVTRAILSICIALTIVEAARVPWQDRIRRIVVLMEENRSYDHLMGWYNKSKTHLTGNEFNYVNASNHSQGKVRTQPIAPYINDCDPNHGYPATTYKIFGPEAYKANNFSTPTMSGFVQWEAEIDGWSNPVDEYCNVMDGFAPSHLPVWYSLVENYVAFDQFFASVPGPTWPNRLFFLGASSKGQTETIPWYRDQFGQLYPLRTIFDQITDTGAGSWKYYYSDTPWELFIESLAHSPEHTHNLDAFYRDAREGTLPNFAFINPRAGINMTTGHGSNDMHPDHDVALSERLYKDVYEALRASPQWNETLFVLTFDEHGGFYDHIKPHADVPPPGDYDFPSYPDNFTFNRGGIRIPTLLISPWLPRGVIESEPPVSQRPQRNSGYELTSIMATVRKLLPFLNETGPLTQRDAWAATFEHLFDVLDEPRTDCPMHLPDPPPAATLAPGVAVEHERPVNSLQSFMMTVNAHLAGVEYPSHIKRQAEVSEWLQTHFHKHRDATLEWKQSKASHPLSTSNNFTLEIVPYIDRKAINCTWDVQRNVNSTAASFDVLSTAMYGRDYCLDLPRTPAQAGDVVTLSLCYPSKYPRNNRDPSQHWYFTADYTVRPATNDTLCVTSSWVNDGSNKLRLEPCSEEVSVAQSFAFMGTAPGMSGGHGPNVGTHHIYFGDDLALWCTMPKKQP